MAFAQSSHRARKEHIYGKVAQEQTRFQLIVPFSAFKTRAPPASYRGVQASQDAGVVPKTGMLIAAHNILHVSKATQQMVLAVPCEGSGQEDSTPVRLSECGCHGASYGASYRSVSKLQ